MRHVLAVALRLGALLAAVTVVGLGIYLADVKTLTAVFVVLLAVIPFCCGIAVWAAYDTVRASRTTPVLLRWLAVSALIWLGITALQITDDDQSLDDLVPGAVPGSLVAASALVGVAAGTLIHRARGPGTTKGSPGAPGEPSPFAQQSQK